MSDNGDGNVVGDDPAGYVYRPRGVVPVIKFQQDQLPAPNTPVLVESFQIETDRFYIRVLLMFGTDNGDINGRPAFGIKMIGPEDGLD